MRIFTSLTCHQHSLCNLGIFINYTFGSTMEMLNRSGPSTIPCGTPVVTISVIDLKMLQLIFVFTYFSQILQLWLETAKNYSRFRNLWIRITISYSWCYHMRCKNKKIPKTTQLLRRQNLSIYFYSIALRDVIKSRRV